MRYLFTVLLLLFFFSSRPIHNGKNDYKSLAIDSVVTIDNSNFRVIRYFENQREQSEKLYDTLLFENKIKPPNYFRFKVYDLHEVFFRCYKRGDNIVISYNFLMENLFTQKKYFFHVYNNLGEIKDLSKIDYLKKEISLSDWAGKMLYINTKKDLHFTITNDTLKILSDKKIERTLFFEKDTFIQEYDYSKIETLSYFEETDSVNAGFDFRFINIVPVKKKDTILFRKWSNGKNQLLLKNKTYKITTGEFIEYYKTGDTIFTKAKFYLKNLTNNKEFSFYTYANIGTSTSYSYSELTAFVSLDKKNDDTGIFTSSFGRTLEPFSIYFKIENNNLRISNLYSDKFYRNQRTTYSLDTLVNIGENDLIDIEKLWNNHAQNNNRIYLNDYNTKHNLKPKANIIVTPKYIDYKYNRKEPIPTEPLVFNLTFENYGQCDFHQSFVINDQIDYDQKVAYNLTFKKEFVSTFKIQLDQIVTGSSHQTFTLKKVGKKIILENEFKTEDDSQILETIFFIFEKAENEYTLTEAYQYYKHYNYYSEIKLIDGVYILDSD